ncbi:hypothetical protein TB2_043384 [Malus domestica]|uniref:Uncharacterized protein n=1 Tax=Malus domestica TaxID=3750 RepID=A0A498J7V7_MALDO|nr:uncharacterized protein LOC103415420 [Malus domestica]RXH91879.1 hypothetical protein DVH24_020902 [Malus domestica]
MEWRPLKEIEANVQMQNPNDEAMFDEATMVDDDEVMGKSTKATLKPKPSWFDDDDDDCIGQNPNDEGEGIQNAIGDPMARLQLRKKRNYCEVCCEEVEDHKSCNCPYFVLVPKGARVGEHCDIVCTECGEQVSKHEGELNVHYEGRAILKYCHRCQDYRSHWTEECESMRK